MNLQELDSYNLADAVKFNDQLNPRIWDGEKMRPEVRDKLLEIAADFKESLGLSDLEVKDITVSGSNAGYTYTPYSDIDLHLVVDIPRADEDEVYRELFDAKKFQYNELHNIKIGGYDVELYVENANKPPVSQGVFSVLNNDWIHIPRKRRATVDDDAVRSKYEDYKHRIDSAVDSKDTDKINTLAKKIKTYRQAGLDAHGELGPENLAYKMLRNQGYIEKLYKARTAARDAELSLAEQNREKKPFVYGYKTMEDATATPDGVNPTTQMFLNETDVPPHEEIIKDFIKFARKKIGLKKLPKFKLHKDPKWSTEHQSFGRYTNETDTIDLAIGERHIMDILRTLAHELQHRKQDERETMPPDAGETGSPYENEAHAVAGVVMREYANLHPEYFRDVPVSESASGYIPKNKKEARLPQYAMALSADIKPGETGRQANKMALKTDAQGKPGLLIKSANLRESDELAENLLGEFKLFEQDLFEVKMTSKNLAKLARDIPGVKVGLEFEMIVPNVNSDDGGDMEPDYDEDQRVRDIDDCVEFFDDGDYNGRNELRRLRENMESDFFDWQIGQMDEAWHNNGFEFFQEYLDREDPFDPADYEEDVEDEIKTEYPDLDPESDEFKELKSQKLQELEANYYTEQWDDQGRNYDYAREEFDDEQRDNFSESDWLDSQGIRYASDVESNYGHVTWPYYRSSGEGETDAKEVALDFMDAMGYKSIAVGDYHGYGGGYQKWNGSEWVKIGSNKPDDCFTVEPDGSLHADDSDDTGLEFVSPPIPLDQIGETMRKVQQWAAGRGVYTGKSNATSMHTNISVPGYDLDKLDYLKAALLLGDEHVLRQFDRIGNTYARPAIEKVKQLVQQKPEKAKELLDKMKSQLNAEASKMIHSGQTDKYTSINTKDNRVEFRSPGGDYLSDIADNPQKMVDTINRMVVTLDAAMNPDKYKQEYQKKLYKVLTGQGGGREAKTGAKQEIKASDKDLLNIFSRYAAGELPKQALKSFVRQAQLERKVARQKGEGVEMWWNVARDGQRMEVVATNELDAKLTAAKEWGIVASDANLSSMTVKPLRPYDDTAGGPQVVAQQSTTPVWGIWDFQRGGFVNSRGGVGDDQGRLIGADTYDATRNAARNNGLLGRLEGGEVEIRQIPQQQPAIPGSNIYRITDTRGGLIAGDEYDNDQAALERAAYWAQRRGVDVVVRNARGEEVGRVSASGEITPAGQQQPAQQSQQGNWGIWIGASERFAREPGEYPAGQEVPLRRFPSREAAEQFLTQTRAENPRMRTDVEVRVIEPTTAQPQAPIGGQNYPRSAQDATGQSSYELYRISDGRTVTAPAGNPIQFSATSPEDAESKIARYAADFNLGAPELFAVRSVLQAPAQSQDNWSADFERRMQGGTVNTANEPTTGSQVGQTYNPSGTGSFTGQWLILNPNNQVIYRFGGIGNAQSDANRIAMNWLTQNPREMVDGVTVVPEMG